MYNDIKPGVAVLVEGEPYACTWGKPLLGNVQYVVDVRLG